MAARVGRYIRAILRKPRPRSACPLPPYSIPAGTVHQSDRRAEVAKNGPVEESRALAQVTDNAAVTSNLGPPRARKRRRRGRGHWAVRRRTGGKGSCRPSVVWAESCARHLAGGLARRAARFDPPRDTPGCSGAPSSRSEGGVGMIEPGIEKSVAAAGCVRSTADLRLDAPNETCRVSRPDLRNDENAEQRRVGIARLQDRQPFVDLWRAMPTLLESTADHRDPTLCFEKDRAPRRIPPHDCGGSDRRAMHPSS